MTTSSIMDTGKLTRTCQNGFTSAGLVAALEQVWAAIRERHPQVPAAVIVIGPGSPTKPSEGLLLGHFSRLRWQHGDDMLPEVLVSGEGLDRPPSAVLTTLLHEAAHGLADVRGVKDTSRQGRWHNKRFAALAVELGLQPSKDDKLGWSPCELPDATRDRYRGVLDGLAAAMQAWRHPDEVVEKKTRTSSNNGEALTCDCPRKIRVSPSVLEEGPILCGVCDAPFLTDEQRESGEHDPMRHAYDPTGAHHGGLPTYPYRLAPDGLATRRQLRAKGLAPGGQEIAAQVVWRRGKRHALLYRLELAVPKRTATPAQREAIDKALLARRRCVSCGRVKDYYIPRRYGECLDCAPAARVTVAGVS